MIEPLPKKTVDKVLRENLFENMRPLLKEVCPDNRDLQEVPGDPVEICAHSGYVIRQCGSQFCCVIGSDKYTCCGLMPSDKMVIPDTEAQFYRVVDDDGDVVADGVTYQDAMDDYWDNHQATQLFDTPEEAALDCIEENRIDVDGYAHTVQAIWAVRWELARALENIGETVIELCGLYLWLRTCGIDRPNHTDKSVQEAVRGYLERN